MDNVRTISRGIDLLEFLNRSGKATGAHIASQLGLSRPSTYRILETLAACGVIRYSAQDNKYALDWPAQTLASGLTERSRVLCVATPYLYELQKEVLWPTDLAIHENGGMVIKESTHPISPYSIESGIVGSRHPILCGSLGRAYISFCPKREREEILKNFFSRCTGGYECFSSMAQIEWMIAKARADGFGSRQQDVNAETSSIAVPIRFLGRVLACMDVSWIASAMTFDEAVKKFYPPLDAARCAVERQLAAETRVN
ncbi:DNA-binding transcriptional activator MhpR [Nitrospirillum viridazoti Y2]|uniref:IclR family transcriptional regulator n=1 Tax=Nitrospirillum amazonense TaxID=28077 RepID=A0A560HK07_9PROT|nr:helix-turn-helix domain-containing protein [Nitrospirillum amazonense]EGY02669.1 DNA-binding transcriptional activator MhpR [Nitrospirillum amazonense Y2]TWB46838.1 IclR family transcriptional regulator [Nitrospirillum amazonense]